MTRLLWLLAYAATIPAANWTIGHVGTCQPGEPCTIPVGFGLVAPSGVLWIGAALAVRDGVQERFGRLVTVAAIVVGVALSVLVAPAAIAAASGAAFLLSEAADFLVYTPLRRRYLPVAVLASGAAGAVVDSMLFLWLAFGSLAFLAGQVVGKVEMAALAAAAIWLWRRRDLPHRQRAG